jgi:hypothetical protein
VNKNSTPLHSDGATEGARIVFQAVMNHSSMRTVRYP